MKKAAMIELIRKELEKIPADLSGDRQNRSSKKLRSYYEQRRENCLKDDPSNRPWNLFMRRYRMSAKKSHGSRQTCPTPSILDGGTNE